MDGWDPMKEAYQNKHFNSYKEGVGRDLSRSSQGNDGIQLLVQNIAPSLGKEGFYNMFAEYGRVTRHKLILSTEDKSKASHGYITMEKLEDAQAAISHLDKTRIGQFLLKVSPALTDEERDRRRKIQKDEEALMASIRKDSAAKNEARFHQNNASVNNSQENGFSRMREQAAQRQNVSGSGSDCHSDFQESHKGARTEPNQPLNNRHLADRGDFLHQAHENMNQNAPYWARSEPKQPFNNRYVAEEVDFHHHAHENMNQNAACGMGVQQNLLYVQPSSLHGNYPGLGRGNFTPRTQAKKFAMSSPPQSSQMAMMKICVYCYKDDCSYLCSRCKMYYCSTECQKNDWPRHKSKCSFISILASDGNMDRAEHSNLIENDKYMYYTTDAETDRQMENTSRSARGFDSDSNEGRTKGRKDKPQQINNNSRCLSNTGKVEHDNMMKSYSNINQTASGRQNNDRAMMGQHRNGNYNGSMNSRKTNFQRLQNEETVIDSSISQFPENSNKTHQKKEGKKPFYQKNKDKVSGHSKENQIHNRRTGVSNGDSEMGRRNQSKGLKENNEERQETQNEPLCKTPDLGNNSRKAEIARDSNPKAEEVGSQSYGNKSRTAVIARDSNPKPEEARSQSYVTELSVPVGAKGQGYLTHFESPFKFWLCMEEFLEPFAEMTVLMMKELSQGRASPPTLCKVGETYGLKHSEEWRRVTVKSVNGQQVTTFYVDYGSTTTARSGDLRPLTADMLQLPAQALCCSLSNLKPLGSAVWPEAATKFVKDWLGEPESRIIHFEVVFKKESYYAMNISINNESLSEVLLSKKMAECVNHQAGLQFLSKDGDQEVPRLMANSMASKIDGVKQGDVLSVMITDFVSAEKIFAQDDTSKGVLDDLASSLQSEYKDSTDSYRPVCGELVAAKFSIDGNWYRAEVVNMDGDSCSLFYVDYGNSEIQTAQNILPIINKQLISVPKQGLLCSWFILKSSDVDFDNINQMLEKYLPASISSEGKFSLLVKGKMKDTLLVDFITTQGLPLSEILSLDLHGPSNNKELNITNESHSSSTATSGSNVPPSCAGISQQPVQKRETMTLSDLGTEMLPKAIGETVNVMVSFVESPAEFYVRLSSTQDLFKIMMKDLDRSVQSSLPLSAPSVGCLAAVLYDKDRVWYRVMVEKIKGTQCQVYFIDYGNREESKLSGLKALQDSACHLPAQAIRCCLKDKPENLSEASIFKFKQQLESKPADVKICGSNETGFFVQVFQGSADIASSLTKKKSNMQLMSPLKLSPKIKKSDLSISSETLPAIGETVAAEISHVDSLSKFFVCRRCENLQLELALVMQTLNEHAESLPLLGYPIVGSVCAAQFSKDSLWYRTRVVEICSQTTCVVQFVDYGNSEKTRMSDLRQIDSTMTMLPGQAIQCCLLGYESELNSEHAMKNVSGMAADLIQQLEAELLNKSVIVKVVDKKQDTWIIRLENEDGECIGISVSNLLENEDGECIGISSPELQTPRLSDLVFVTPPEKDFDAIISSISSPTEFYCQKLDMKLEEELSSLSESLRDDVSKLSASVCCDPVVGNVYASIFLGTWYRCVVEKMTGSSVLIRYIDYGNTEEVSASCLKPLKPERLAVPVKLLKCKLNGVAHMEENWSDKGLVPFLEILQQQMVHVVIKAVEENTFFVSVLTSDGDMAEYLAKNGAVRLSKGTPSQNEEKSPLPTPVRSLQQMRRTEPEDDDEYNEEDLQRQIQELQLQLQKSQLKKKPKQ